MRGIATLFVVWLGFGVAAAALPQTNRCADLDGYPAALCLYRQERFREADRLLIAIVDRNAPETVTLKARYFLGRSLMKQGRWKEASDHWIALYSASPLFYREWSCDFLLGECRRGLGKD